MKRLYALYIFLTVVILLLITSAFFLLRSYSDNAVQASVSVSSESVPTESTAETDAAADTESESSTAETVSETEPPTENGNTNIVLNFMGDCTLGTYCGEFTEKRFNETAERVEPEYFFAGVQDILDQGTFNITNCEGVFTDNPLVECYKDYSPAFWFKSPAKNARIFARCGIDVVGIANNHIYDYGEEGRRDTIRALVENGVEWSDSTKPVILEKDGIKIVLFCVAMWDENMPDSLCENIEEYSSTTDLQIVFYHGGTEAVHQPDEYKSVYARQFIDAGADLVVGSHPHVLQPIEEYNGVKIVHSIGNFVFGGNISPENRTIVYTHTFSFKDGKLTDSSETIWPCYIYTGDMNEYQPVLIDDEYDKQAVLDFMYGKTDSPFGY
ncbi:MAG: CapA family protein [Porcipelethomonas sp.]